MFKQKRDEMVEAAKKRQKLAQEASASASGDSSSPQQGANANAGTQLTNASSSASAGNPSGGSAAVSNLSAAKTPTVLPSAPIHLLDNGQVKQVYQMNTDQVKALATAMGIDVDSKTKTDLMTEVIRFNGSCDSVKSFDVDDSKFEFENIKKQDFQQPATQLSSA